MGRPPKDRVEDSIDIPAEDQGKNDVEMFENINQKAFKGQILGEVCEPEGYGTGSIALDAALTVPIPKGFICEVFADNGVGKTTLVLEMLGQGQLRGCRVGYLDLEGTLNQSLVKSIRTLDVDKKDDQGQPLWIYKEGLIKDKETGQTRMLSGEEAMRYVENFVGMFKDAYIAVDSVDSIVPNAIIEKEIGENTMGQLGKLLSESLRKLHALCKMNKTTIIFINQVRDNPGVMFGNPETTPGGKALKFYSSVRLRLSKPSAGIIKDSHNNIIGHTVKVNIVKNKVPTTSSETEFKIMYGNGIDRESEIASLGIQLGLIDFWTDEKGVQAKRIMNVAGQKVEPSKLRDFFVANPKIAEEYLQKIKNAI